MDRLLSLFVTNLTSPWHHVLAIKWTWVTITLWLSKTVLNWYRVEWLGNAHISLVPLHGMNKPYIVWFHIFDQKSIRHCHLCCCWSIINKHWYVSRVTWCVAENTKSFRLCALRRNLSIIWNHPQEEMENSGNEYARDPWVQALIEDDVTVIKNLINESSKRKELLEVWFPADTLWNNLPEEDAASHRIATIRRSWTLAAVCGSYKVMKYLYATGIDVHQVDSLGNNVIHTLIIYSNEQEESAELHSRTYHYIESLVSRNEMSSLLQSENHDGLRPVEVAAHFQTFLLLKAIFDNRDIYLTKSVVCGLSVVEYYDVSDYESIGQHRPLANSPLFSIIFSHVNKLTHTFSAENFTSGIIGNWLRSKQKIFSPIIAMWAIFRLAVIALVMVVELPVPANKMAPCTLQLNPSATTLCFLNTSLSSIAALCLTYDIYDIITVRHFLPAWRKTYSLPYGEVMAQ